MDLDSDTDSGEEVPDLAQLSELELDELAQLMSSDPDAEPLTDEDLPPLDGHLVAEYKDGPALKLRLNALIQKENLGYALNIGNSHPSRGDWTLQCSLGGKRRNTRNLEDKDRQRESNSIKIDCPFKIRVENKERGKGGRELTEWKVRVQNNTHCHPKIKDLRALREHRLAALDSNIREEIVKSLHAGNDIRGILASLEGKGIKNLIAKDVSNLAYQEHLKNLRGRAPLKALFDSLQGRNVSESDQNKPAMIWDIRKNENLQLTHLFIAHPKSVEILQDNHDILLLDCTYKTNKYRLPLLNIILVTALHRTINLGFVFLHSEKEKDYT